MITTMVMFTVAKQNKAHRIIIGKANTFLKWFMFSLQISIVNQNEHFEIYITIMYDLHNN